MDRTRILVWDLPVRVFHWMLAASFAGAFLTAESERVRDVHIALGYTFVGLLAFRLVWGLVGSRHARFRSFAYGPAAVISYLRSLLSRQPDHHAGHNPAGSWVIFGMVALGLVIGASGLAVYNGLGGRWAESLHEGVSNAMLGLVILHLAGVVVSSFVHRENLVAAMVTGYKGGRPSEAIGGTRWAMAAALVAAVAVYWSGILDSSGMPQDPARATTSRGAVHSHQSHDEARGHDG
jgi:cytochrome b